VVEVRNHRKVHQLATYLALFGSQQDRSGSSRQQAFCCCIWSINDIPLFCSSHVTLSRCVAEHFQIFIPYAQRNCLSVGHVQHFLLLNHRCGSLRGHHCSVPSCQCRQLSRPTTHRAGIQPVKPPHSRLSHCVACCAASQPTWPPCGAARRAPAPGWTAGQGL
jgi:hypothetical protein